LKGSSLYRKILRHGTDGFTSPKEGVLRICIALKNPSPSAGFELADLGFNSKHANHCTNEDGYHEDRKDTTHDVTSQKTSIKISISLKA
jgi:hypothetical protein